MSSRLRSGRGRDCRSQPADHHHDYRRWPLRSHRHPRPDPGGAQEGVHPALLAALAARGIHRTRPARGGAIKRPEAPGVVASILAIGVAVSVGALSIAAAIAEASKSLNLSEGAVTLLSTVLGAVVGALATYVGTTRTGGPDVPAEEPPEEPH
jgi:hypothetical protein